MSIVLRVVLSFVFLGLFFIGASLLALDVGNSLKTSINKVTEEHTPLVQNTGQLANDFIVLDKNQKTFLSSLSEEELEHAEDLVSKSINKLLVTFAEVTELILIDELMIDKLKAIENKVIEYTLQAETARKDYRFLLNQANSFEKDALESLSYPSEMRETINRYLDNDQAYARALYGTFNANLNILENNFFRAINTNDAKEIIRLIKLNKSIIKPLRSEFGELNRVIPVRPVSLMKGRAGHALNKFEETLVGKGGLLDRKKRYLIKKKLQHNNVLRLNDMIEETLELIYTMNKSAKMAADDSAYLAEQNFYQYRQVVLGAIGFATFCGLLILINLTRAVKLPLNQLQKTLSLLANDDLSEESPDFGKNEFGILSRAINQVIQRLRAIVEEMSRTSYELRKVSDVNLAASHKFKKDSQTTLNDVSSVNKSMHQLENSFTHVMASANCTKHSVDDVTSAAKKSSEVMMGSAKKSQELAQKLSESSDAIDHVKGLSYEIGGILDVIRGIADQTNLLALNAAIEAARAGEQGRGFAIVADEVRDLAQKTANATTQIKTMIDNLQSSAVDAVSVMATCSSEMTLNLEKNDDVFQALNNVHQLIKIIAEMSSSIVAVTDKQKATSTLIAGNMEQVSKNTEDNHQTIEKVSEVSETLNKLVSQQDELVGQFKI